MQVLILIVVEDGLVPKKPVSLHSILPCLNPYCSGRWSRTYGNNFSRAQWRYVLILIVVEDGLVQLLSQLSQPNQLQVLILIVVEDGLVLSRDKQDSQRCRFVLILIVVEDGLVPSPLDRLQWELRRLNPYCSGRWSRTIRQVFR